MRTSIPANVADAWWFLRNLVSLTFLVALPTLQRYKELLNDLNLIPNYRFSRLDPALTETPIYLHLVIVGFLLSMACFGAYKP